MSTTTAKEHPMLFSAAMVRAILDRRKTQTRRAIKPQPSNRFFVEGVAHLTHGMPPDEDGRNWYDADGVKPGRLVRPPWRVGDRIWLKETWAKVTDYDGNFILDKRKALYRADNEQMVNPSRWRPSIHMPRWASRATLEVTGVRAERLREISEEDAKAEGVKPYRCPQADALMNAVGGGMKPIPYTSGFANLWNSIAKPGETWDANPWVWVIEFRLEEK